MTDSPALRVPIDPQEQPILDQLLSLRDRLTILKQDRTTYIKSQDIIPIYDAVVEQVHQINDLREARQKAHEQNRGDKHPRSPGAKVSAPESSSAAENGHALPGPPTQENATGADNRFPRAHESKVDNVLEDCFQLISLFFLTIGRNNEAPAGYALTSTMKRLLDHLKEAGFYYVKDLDGIELRIQTMREQIQRGREKHSEHILTLLVNRLDNCHHTLQELRGSISSLSSELAPTYEKLVSILRSLALANTRHIFPQAEVEGFKAQLLDIKATMVDGSFVGKDGTKPGGQEVTAQLLKRCLTWSDIVLEKRGIIDSRFAGSYSKLIEIRNQLEKLSLTQAWSLRETDLYSYQRQLDRIDEGRTPDGNFLDENGKPADLYVQRTLLYLIRRSYAYIYGLILASEPVSEALLPVYNQLQTLRRCLIQVKQSGGVSSIRELYPYSMKLNSIDNLRVDGKFVVGGDIPEGQGSLSALLADCFDMTYELKCEAEEKPEE